MRVISMIIDLMISVSFRAQYSQLSIFSSSPQAIHNESSARAMPPFIQHATLSPIIFANTRELI
jgi:hypothetical protein